MLFSLSSLNSITGSTTLTVTTAVLTSIQVTPANPSIPLGRTQQFIAIGTFSDSSTQDITTQVMWSSTSTIASISNASGSQGLATSKGKGTTPIQATLNNLIGSTTLTVTAAVLDTIQVTPSNSSISAGFTQQFKAMGTFSDSSTQNLTTTVTWASSSTSIATISNTSGSQGLAKGVAQGSTTISATSGTISSTTTLTITAALLQSIVVTPANPTLSMGSTLPFTATGTYSDSHTQNLTNSALWASSNSSTASISNVAGSQGVATGLKQGNTTISATVGSFSGSTPLFVQGPLITSIVDNFGPKAGGKTSTIIGVGLLNTTAVNFGSTPAASFKVKDDTSITVVSPPGALSTVQISVLVGTAISPASSNPYYAYQGNWIAYVATDSNLTPIDLSNNTPQTHIPMPRSPSDIAITPDGTTAYVCIFSFFEPCQVVPVSLVTNTPGTAISIPLAQAISITPDGTLAYVTSPYYVIVIDLTNNRVIKSIPCTLEPLLIETGITPDGTTAFVTNISGSHLIPINTTTQAQEPLVDVGGTSLGIAMNPSGTKAYICLPSTDSVGSLLLATRQLETEIPLSGELSDIDAGIVTITPDGTTAYVATQANVTPITLATNKPQSPITFPYNVSELAVTPDAAKGYATIIQNPLVIPVTLATHTLGTSISMPGVPLAIAITPDPAPIAVFTATVAPVGSPTSFNASLSVSSVGTITSYAWNFGDSKTLTTATPIVNHTYTNAGSYSVTLTVTNSAGTSTTQVFTGQMVSRNGGPSATMTQTISVS